MTVEVGKKKEKVQSDRLHRVVIPPGTPWSSREGCEDSEPWWWWVVVGWRGSGSSQGVKISASQLPSFPSRTSGSGSVRGFSLSRPPVSNSEVNHPDTFLRPPTPPGRPPAFPPPLLSPQTSSRILGSTCFPIAVFPVFDLKERRSSREQSLINHTPATRVQSSGRMKNYTWERLQPSGMT